MIYLSSLVLTYLIMASLCFVSAFIQFPLPHPPASSNHESLFL